MASYTLALNTYSVKRRGMATGIAMAATGIGPLIMPRFVHFLIKLYGGAKYAGLIIAALSLHSFVGALLLQPVKWHRKTNGQSTHYLLFFNISLNSGWLWLITNVVSDVAMR